MSKKLWGGRFKKQIDPDFERFSASYQWDKRLLPYDLKIDAAHIKALKKCGVLSSSEEKRLDAAIRAIQKKHETGTLRLDPGSEDIHSAIQSQLQQFVGPLAN